MLRTDPERLALFQHALEQPFFVQLACLLLLQEMEAFAENSFGLEPEQSCWHPELTSIYLVLQQQNNLYPLSLLTEKRVTLLSSSQLVIKASMAD